tara:strand:+ start:126 stop:434 length:309 start_codon:yes stop_codon:yes gene_type:complete
MAQQIHMDDDSRKRRLLLIQGFQLVIIYSLSITVGIAVNEAIRTGFNSFPGSDNIINKATYAVVLSAIVIAIAYFVNRQQLEMSDTYTLKDIAAGKAWHGIA